LHAGPFKSKPKTDPARVSTLLETLKSDPDEKKRKSAADELGGADARIQPEVASGLSTALQKDASAAVRAEAARSLGQLDQVFPLAGVALEAAAAGDPSPIVRLAAKQTLWEYHLNGYRSPKGADGLTTQTVEPPIAPPAGARPVVALIPVPPPAVPTLPPPAMSTAAPSLPAAAAPPIRPSAPPAPPLLFGPRATRPMLLVDLMPALRPAPKPTPLNGPPPILNLTPEPPIAKRPAVMIPVAPVPTPMSPVPPPTVAIVPQPPFPAPQRPDFAPTLPPFQPELPSVVLPPDATPFVPPPTPRIPATLPSRERETPKPR
jgi:hypothetical protein